MTGGEWQKSACILCYINCGIEVQCDGSRITKVRGDKANRRSEGYLCQKAQRLPYYTETSERLTSPLRRRADGGFDEIDWPTAMSEIAEKLTTIRDDHGPRSLAFYGGGGQGNHMGGGYGIAVMRAMGSTSYYSSLAQEKTGDFWVNGLMFGAQNCHTSEAVEAADLVVFLGANPWMAHGIANARKVLNALKKNGARKMIVIDPRRTETADMADLHLQVKPGGDAYLLGAILALLVQRDLVDTGFLDAHTVDFKSVQEAFMTAPVDAWIEGSGVSAADVNTAVAMITDAKAMSIRAELGIQQSKNSTLNSYLEKLLFLLTGNFGREGTNGLHSWLQPLWGNSRGARSAVTEMTEIAGLYPPNRFPAEVLSDHPDRLRAVFVDSSNPANSGSDSADFESALAALDLLVVVDVAMTETARLADYVLPASSQYEKWEFTLFQFEFPTNHFHLRAPVLPQLPGTKTEPQIYAEMTAALGLLPDQGVLDELRQTAATDKGAFMGAFGALLKQKPGYGALAPVLLSLTFGQTLPEGATGAAVLLPGCLRVAKEQPVAVARAIDGRADDPALGIALFDRIIASRSGTPFTVHEPEDAFGFVRHPDQKIHLAIPKLLESMLGMDPAADVAEPEYPFTLFAGQRRAYNANQILRIPAWRKSDQEGGLAIHPDDLEALGGTDGGWVTVQTRRGQLTVRAQADDRQRQGSVALPHGYGMDVTEADGSRVVVGPRINMITASDDCDPIAATPYHKTVAAALRRASNEEVHEAEDLSRRVQAVIAAF
jgi:anaerobic selenocysteine-containing dehydrogenase